MNLSYTIDQLENNINVFKSLLQHQKPQVYKWRSEADKWTLLEILCHLCDEERDDFGKRLNFVLNNPGESLPPSIDPLKMVTERKYAEQDFSLKLKEFEAERKKTIQYLKNLKNPDWNSSYHHPKFGPLTAEMFLVNWLAHDYLHIRQITKTLYQYLRSTTIESLNYAGEW